MSHFTALDVETANADMSSICQIGLVEFENGAVVKQWGTYVNPEDYFDPFNTVIHGITEEMVQDSPKFSEIHAVVQKAIAKRVIVTHMPFDQTSLRRAFEKYGLPELSCTWLDSARVARRHWEQFRQSGYNLPNLAKHLGIQYKAHDAIDDARAAGEVVWKAIIESNQTLEEWLERAYKRITPSQHQFVSHAQEGNPDGLFYGETIAFTGALSLPRKDAARLAAEAGCSVGDGVTKQTTILVVGIQNIDKLAGYEKSSKHRKAEKLIADGQMLRIITEKDFIGMVS